jgi:hypothetical protein
MDLLKPFHVLPPLLQLVLVYMLATPLFWLADVLFGFEIRIAFLEDTAWKSVYYAVLTGSAITCYLRPAWIAIVAFVESTANIFIHILSFIVPIFYLPGQVLHGEAGNAHIETGNVLGFAMVGIIMVLSFQSAVGTLSKQ